VLGVSLGYGQAVNSCLDCHSGMEGKLQVTPDKFSLDIHGQKGLTCTSCHGGDASSYDPAEAMNRNKGWKGKIDRKQIPQLCGTCHSTRPSCAPTIPACASINSTSTTPAFTASDWPLATARSPSVIDCHSVHDIRPPSDPRSTVNPVNVAKTCSRCHSDAGYMKSYGIPTDQFANYNTSVHHDALAVRGDLSAPTCTTCHGNHGAVPPGVDKFRTFAPTATSFQAQMYQKSTHSKAFADKGLPGCVVCHTNHGIHKPSDVMLSTGPAGVCMRCHAPGDHCDQARANILDNLTLLDQSVNGADQALRRAEAAGYGGERSSPQSGPGPRRPHKSPRNNP